MPIVPPPIGFHANIPLSSTDAERLAVLDRAWELGCTHWDTSDIYGDNEDLFCKWFKLHPERRRDIFLATKSGIVVKTKADGIPDMSVNSSPEYVREACERRLKRLGVDYGIYRPVLRPPT